MISLPLCLSLLVYLSLSLLPSITQPPPIVLCTTTSTTSKDKQPPEVPLQPAQPPEVPQPEDQVPVFPQPVAQMPIANSFIGIASNHLSSGFASNNSHYNPSSTGIFWNNNHNPLSARLNPQLPAAQVPVFPQPVAQMPIANSFTGIASNHLSSGIASNHLSSGIASNNSYYNPQRSGIFWNNNHNPSSARLNPQLPAAQVPVFPQPVAQMPIAWNSSRYNTFITGTASNNNSFTGIASNHLSSGIASNNSHYNPSSAGIFWNNNHNPLSARLNPQLPAAQVPVFQQPNQEDGNAPSSVTTSGNNDRNNDGRVQRYGPEKRRACVERYLRKRACRNFGKKIMYAVRKEQADSRPRKGGRFVKDSEAEPSHRYGIGVLEPDYTRSGSGSVMPSTAQLQEGMSPADEQKALPTQQDTFLQSQQELASQNSELRSLVHRQGHEILILPSWQNASSESGFEATTWEQKLHAAGLCESGAGGGDDHASGSGDEATTWERELLQAAGFLVSDAGGGDDHVPGKDPS